MEIKVPDFFELIVFGLVHGAIAGTIWAKIQNSCAGES